MLLYSGRHLVHYGQIALLDAEDKSSYPNPVGPLPWIGPKGGNPGCDGSRQAAAHWIKHLVQDAMLQSHSDRPIIYRNHW